jgi:hypothetical protein
MRGLSEEGRGKAGPQGASEASICRQWVDVGVGGAHRGPRWEDAVDMRTQYELE